MGVFDKLKFWKKKEPDFNLAAGPDLGMDLNAPMPGLDADFGLGTTGGFGAPNAFEPQQQRPDFGFAKPADMQREEIPADVRNAPAFGGAFAPQPQFQPMQAQQTQTSQQEAQMLSSKLDTVRAMLDSIDQRLKNIERMEEKQERERGRW